MKIAVVNGVNKRGTTARLKEIFLQPFREQAEIVEYDLPERCAYFVTTCENCLFSKAHSCEKVNHLHTIEDVLLEAELIIMTVPAHILYLLDTKRFQHRYSAHRRKLCRVSEQTLI